MTVTIDQNEDRAKALVLIQEIQGIAEKADGEGRDFTDAERATVTAKMDEAKALKRKADAADGMASIRSQADEIGRWAELGATGVPAPGPFGQNGRRKSLGDRFIEAPQTGEWLKRVGPALSGGSKAPIGNSPAVMFSGAKDILAGSDVTGGGALLAPDFRGLADATGTFQRPLVLRDLVTSGTTTSDQVSYARVVGFTNNAAPVPEATGTSAGDATADVTGTKPESDLELEQVTTNVKTIAHWLPATKRALSDAGQVRTLIDNFLRYGLEEELEEQIATGDGSGENFEGVLQASNTQAVDASDITSDATGALALIEGLRIAKRKVRVGGRATASAFVLNPADNEAIDLARDLNGQFYFGGPGAVGTSQAWGLPRIESEAVTEGTAICADWRQAVLWDREQASVSVSDSHQDFFVRNLVAILAELRAAFGIVRPAAFVIIDATALLAVS